LIKIPELMSPQLDLGAFGLEIEPAILMHEVRRFTRDHFTPLVPGTIISQDVHTDCNAILQRLLHFQITFEANSTSACLSEACRYACSLLLFYPFENPVTDPTLLLNGFMHKLKSPLSKLLPSSGHQNQLLIWLLAVGGVQALELPEKEWFIAHLVVVAENLGLQSWDDMKFALEGIIWVDAFRGKAFQQLWEETSQVAEVLAGQNPSYSLSAEDFQGSLRSRYASSSDSDSESGPSH
jgi:hypothetical protein